MNIDISKFSIESYDEVLELWQQCEGIGLSDADSRQSIQSYLNRNPGMSFVALFVGLGRFMHPKMPSFHFQQQFKWN